jgi:hypothetical protein
LSVAPCSSRSRFGKPCCSASRAISAPPTPPAASTLRYCERKSELASSTIEPGNSAAEAHASAMIGNDTSAPIEISSMIKRRRRSRSIAHSSSSGPSSSARGRRRCLSQAMRWAHTRKPW